MHALEGTLEDVIGGQGGLEKGLVDEIVVVAIVSLEEVMGGLQLVVGGPNEVMGR